MHLFDQCMYVSDVAPGAINSICDGMDEMECLRDFNTGWTTVFKYNAVVLYFLTMSFVAVAVGAWIYWARLAGAACACFWNCCQFIALMTTAANRFSKQGRLCALSENLSSYYSGDEDFSETWTFEKDGRTMTDLWGTQLLFFALIVSIGICPLCVPKPPAPRVTTVEETIMAEELKAAREAEGKRKLRVQEFILTGQGAGPADVVEQIYTSSDSESSSSSYDSFETSSSSSDEIGGQVDAVPLPIPADAVNEKGEPVDPESQPA